MRTVIYCKVPECPNFILVYEPASTDATFVCRDHAPRAIEETRIQFDPEIPRKGSSPNIDSGDNISPAMNTGRFTHRTDFDLETDIGFEIGDE